MYVCVFVWRHASYCLCQRAVKMLHLPMCECWRYCQSLMHYQRAIGSTKARQKRIQIH